MPAAGFGHLSGGQFVRVQTDRLLIGAVVPLDRVAAVAAPAALAAAQQPADAAGSDLQRAAHAVSGDRSAVPMAGGGGWAVHAREPASRHAEPWAALPPDRPFGLAR